MSDIPTKTYPPSFLRALIADHEAERAGATPEASSAVETKGDAMSEIQRFTIYGPCVVTPVDSGEWIRYDDHRAEVERLTGERDEAMAERDAAQRERERLQDLLTLAAQELSTLRDRLRVLQADPSDQINKARAQFEWLTSQLATMTVVVEQGYKLKAYAEALAETDRVVADGNKALAEVGRLTNERDKARANGQAILDSSRPTDEDIWREAFMALCGQSLKEGYMIRAESADAALAVYRQRWPR